VSPIWHRARFALDHRWAPGRASAYIDSELGDGARTRLERHLHDCPECRRLLAELRRMVNELGRLAAPGGAPDARRFAAAVHGRLDEPPPP